VYDPEDSFLVTQPQAYPMSFQLLHPRDQLVATMQRIYAHDMTTTSGGNISIRDENDDMWITPARVE
jgi:L-fuculose-phosphate aldolase